MRRKKEVFSAKTGTGASSEVQHNLLVGGKGAQPIMVKLELSYGVSPDLAIALQGKKGNTWEDIISDTFLSGSPVYIHAPVQKRYRRYRLNITVNTDTTVDKAYIGIGRVED